MRELEFLPPWYPSLRQARRLLILRARVGSVLTVILVGAAVAARLQSAPELHILAGLAGMSAAAVGAGLVMTSLWKLSRLTAQSVSGPASAGVQ